MYLFFRQQRFALPVHLLTIKEMTPNHCLQKDHPQNMNLFFTDL